MLNGRNPEGGKSMTGQQGAFGSQHPPWSRVCGHGLAQCEAQMEAGRDTQMHLDPALWLERLAEAPQRDPNWGTLEARLGFPGGSDGKQPRCSSADEWIRKLWYIYTMEYHSAIKNNTLESVLMKWMKLEPIIQSEVSQNEKHQYSILMHIYGT